MGALVTGTLTGLTSGQQLTAVVGGDATGGSSCVAGGECIGGSNGGADAGGGFGGGGGGASDIRTEPSSLSSRLVVAAGGGGAGSSLDTETGGCAQGSPGGRAGEAGADGSCSGGTGGQAGGTADGGAGGIPGGAPGTLGTGGAGGANGGGGGGGGSYGGGGGGSFLGFPVFGAGGGGGGGESLLPPGDGSRAQADEAPRITITYEAPAPAGPADVSLDLQGPPTVNRNGTFTYTLVATNNGPGTAQDISAVLGTSRYTQVQSTTPAAQSGTYRGLSGTLWKTTADLAPGQQATFTATVKANAPGGTSILAAAAAGSQTEEPNWNNNADALVTRVNR
ncbi:hypothetical protein [Streptomyces sp. NPDC001774]